MKNGESLQVAWEKQPGSGPWTIAHVECPTCGPQRMVFRGHRLNPPRVLRCPKCQTLFRRQDRTAAQSSATAS